MLSLYEDKIDAIYYALGGKYLRLRKSSFQSGAGNPFGYNFWLSSNGVVNEFLVAMVFHNSVWLLI